MPPDLMYMEDREREGIIRLLEGICRLHETISNDWDQYARSKKFERYNLKTMQIADANRTPMLLDYIHSYQKFLGEKSETLTQKVDDLCDTFVITDRIKTLNSMKIKLIRYMSSGEKGKVSINKCYNDLFGLRIKLDSRVDFEIISDIIESSRACRMSCIDSTKYDKDGG